MINNKINYPKAISTWLKKFDMNVDTLLNRVKHPEEIRMILECSKEYPSWYEFVEICNGLNLTLYEFFDENCDVFEGNFKGYNYNFSIRESLQNLIDEHRKTAMGISCSMKMPQLAIESILDGANPNPSMKNVSKILVACNTALYDFFAKAEYEEFITQPSEEVKQEEETSEFEEKDDTSMDEDTSTAKQSTNNLYKNYSKKEIIAKSVTARIDNIKDIDLRKVSGKNRRVISDNDVRMAVIRHFELITSDLKLTDVADKVQWTNSKTLASNNSYIYNFRYGVNMSFDTLIKFCDSFHVSLHQFLNPNIKELSYFDGKNGDIDLKSIMQIAILKKGYASYAEFKETAHPKCNVYAIYDKPLSQIRLNTLIAFCSALGMKLWELFDFQNESKKNDDHVEKTIPITAGKLMNEYLRLSIEERNKFLLMVLNSVM